MIQSKPELKYYIQRDTLADNYEGFGPKLFGSWPNTIWKYKIFLRKAEYYRNTANGKLVRKIAEKYYLYRYTRLGIKLGFTIPLNVAKEGLSLPHYGTIVINADARIGKNCRIMADVCVGSTNGVNKAASIGDNVYIGAGSKIIGNIIIGDNVCIGANSVVTKNIDPDITIGGIPAKKISDNNSWSNISRVLLS